MMRSLGLKLTLAFLVVAVMGTVLVALFVGQRTQDEFGRFVLDRYRADVVTELAAYYEKNGSWEGLDATAVRDLGGHPGRWGPGWIRVTLIDAHSKVVYGGSRYHVGEQVPRPDGSQSLAIRVNDETVGWLLLDSFRARERLLPGSPESAFLTRVTRAITFGALGAMVIALLLGVLLARTISRPVRELTAATQRVARGELGLQVPVRARDELGELAASFNQMSADLAQSNELRRHMTADIAHELRTPLSVILGYTEALSDGKLQATPQTFTILHDGAKHLSRLVEDLQTLALADAGELSLTRRPVDPRVLLEHAASAYTGQAEEKGISLSVEAAPDLPEVEVDPDRMAQVLGNLLTNALRHTPAGGRVSMQCSVISQQLAVISDQSSVISNQTAADGKLITDNCLLITVTDTGAGIAPEDLPHVFERFYRGDKSRQRQEGESGLGLAIAKSIVQMHGGSIAVDSTPGEGTTFSIVLPLDVSGGRSRPARG
ncbi:MAG: ATP-binding protein [Anaerolineae bacterium]